MPPDTSSEKTVNFQSYPKTGNTWSRLMLGNYFQLMTGLPGTILLEGDEEENKSLNRFGLPGFFASHAPLLWDTQTADDLSYENVVKPFVNRPTILMVRYPLDAVLSHFMQHQYGWRNETRIKFSSFFDFARHRVLGIEKAIRFYNIWADALGSDRVFALKYEALRTATGETMLHLLNFLHIPHEERALAKAIELASFDNMRTMELSGNAPRYKTSGFKIFATGDLNDQKSYFVREGKFRGYREHLNAEQRTALESIIQSQLSPKYGYD
jgi:hypothetical protein